MKQVDNLVLISGVTWTRNAESIKRNDVSVVRKNIPFVFVRRKSFDRSPGFFYPSCAPLSLFYLVALLVITMFTFFCHSSWKVFFFFVRLTLITSLVHSQALLTFSMNFPRSILESRTQRFLKTLPYFKTIKSLVLVEQFSRACCYIKLNIK